MVFEDFAVAPRAKHPPESRLTKTNENERKPTKTNENQRKPTKTDSQRTIFAENRLVWGGKGGKRSHSLMTPDKQGSADWY